MQIGISLSSKVSDVIDTMHSNVIEDFCKGKVGRDANKTADRLLLNTFVNNLWWNVYLIERRVVWKQVV